MMFTWSAHLFFFFNLKWIKLGHDRIKHHSWALLIILMVCSALKRTEFEDESEQSWRWRSWWWWWWWLHSAELQFTEETQRWRTFCYDKIPATLFGWTLLRLQNLYDVNLPFHHIPMALYWIVIWCLWRSLEYCELINMFQKPVWGVLMMRFVTWCIILLETAIRRWV